MNRTHAWVAAKMRASYHPPPVPPFAQSETARNAARLRALSIVLPAHDEVENLRQVVESALRVARGCVDSVEVLIVDDGSGDGTAALAETLAQENNDASAHVRVLSHAVNRGYGAALRTGFGEARHEHIFYTDADGQFELTELPDLLSLLSSFDVATGYRQQRRDGRLRSLFGATFTTASNLLLGVHVRDVNCAFKVYPRALFQMSPLHTNGALIDAEMLAAARRAGLSIGEMPVTHRPRAAGEQSGARMDVIAQAVVEMARLLARRARSKPSVPAAAASGAHARRWPNAEPMNR